MPSSAPASASPAASTSANDAAVAPPVAAGAAAPAGAGHATSARRGGLRLLAGFALLVPALALLLVFFPWDWLRGPINRYVTERTGRHFAITRHLDVRLGRVTTVVADGIELANPTWARDPWLLRAQGAQFEVRLWPLLSRGELVLPHLRLRRPELGLQVQPDGRRTWSLDRQQQDARREPQIGELVVDQGVVRYFAPGQRIDIAADVALAAESAAPLPLQFRGGGQWRGQAFAAQGRAGGVLRLSANRQAAFPLEIEASAGATRLQAQGRITHLAELAGMDMAVRLQGRNLAHLFHLFGVALPASPDYQVQGQLRKQGRLWQFQQLQGRLGRSDLQGELQWDRRRPVPLLGGEIRSRRLDLADLGPMIGLPPPRTGPRSTGRRPPRQGPILPAQPLDFSRLGTLDADVGYAAARIHNAPRWPLESIRTRVRLQAGRLVLDPLELGVAGGRLAGAMQIDNRADPPALQVQLQAHGLQLGRLLPQVETSRSSLGAAGGRVQLQGRGRSVAQILGSASGDVSLLTGRGRISNILLEFMGLDGGEIVKFLVRGDQNIRLRCAAVAFDVRQGQMDSRVILLDTVDTIVRGQGRIDLARERLDLYFEPEPKDTSIFSLRSPLRITGTLGAPVVGPDKAALAGRAGLAVALAALNPLLALAATLETGPGEDANCSAVLRQAAAPSGTKEAGPRR